MLGIHRVLMRCAYQVATVVCGHVVTIVARLPLQALTQRIVVLVIAGKLPVLKEAHEQRRPFPPLCGERSRDISSLITGIPSHHGVGTRACRIFD